MDQYFERIQQLLSRTDFPARIRFMIEDVIDLRNAKVDFQMHQLNFDCKYNIFYFVLFFHYSSYNIMYDTPRNKKKKMYLFLLLSFWSIQCKIKPQCVKSEAYMSTCFSLGGNFQNLGLNQKCVKSWQNT